MTDKKKKPADQKALELLLYRDRSVSALSDKLRKYDYNEEEIASAIEAVSGFGYLNDEKYAGNYISLNMKRKGRTAIIRELKAKGIDEEIIEKAVSETEFDEEGLILEMLIKKAGEPHALNEKEYRRLFGFFARRGFPQGLIHKILKNYSKEDEYGC